MAANIHTYIHTTSANAVTRVWGSLRLTPTILWFEWCSCRVETIQELHMNTPNVTCELGSMYATIQAGAESGGY